MSSRVHLSDADEDGRQDGRQDSTGSGEKEFTTIYANDHFKTGNKIVTEFPLMNNDKRPLDAEDLSNLKIATDPKSLSKGAIPSGDGDALRGSNKLGSKSRNDGAQPCPRIISEQNSECGEENFGRADILRPILTEEERKMLGVSPFPKSVGQAEGGKGVPCQDDEDEDYLNLAITSKSCPESDNEDVLPNENPLQRSESLQYSIRKSNIKKQRDEHFVIT